MSRVYSFDLLEKYIGNTDERQEEAAAMRLKQADLSRVLRKVIANELTENQRKMILFYYYERRTMPEIAELLGVNKSTVSRTIARGRNTLKRVLEYSVY